MPSLFLIHCGFSNPGLGGGIFEGHVDFFVAAENFDEARAKAKELPEYRARKMHVDGMLKINEVEGFRVELKPVRGKPAPLAIEAQKGFSFRGRKKKSSSS